MRGPATDMQRRSRKVNIDSVTRRDRMTWRRGMGRNTISQIGVGLVFMGVVWGQDGLQRALFGELVAGFDGAEMAVVMRVSRPFSTDVQVTVRVVRGRAESVALETGKCLECALGRATDLRAEYARLAGGAPRRVVRSMPVGEARALVAEAERVVILLGGLMLQIL
jgi:hypothetical protein